MYIQGGIILNKQVYLEMDYSERASYLNQELASGKGLDDICRDLGIRKSNLVVPLEKKGYQFIDGVFSNVTTDVSINSNQDRMIDAKEDHHQENTVGVVKYGGESGVNSISQKTKEKVPESEKKCNTDVITDILTRLNNIEQYIYDFKPNDNQIKVELPDGSIKLVSFRINETVYSLWKEFTASKEIYRSQDLLGMALIEFIERHK